MKEQGIVRELLKLFIKSLVNQEKNIEGLAKYLSDNENVLKIVVQTKDLLPSNEMGDLLKLSNEQKYDELMDDMSHLVDIEDSLLDDEIEKFLIKYNI